MFEELKKRVEQHFSIVGKNRSNPWFRLQNAYERGEVSRLELRDILFSGFVPIKYQRIKH